MPLHPAHARVRTSELRARGGWVLPGLHQHLSVVGVLQSTSSCPLRSQREHHHACLWHALPRLHSYAGVHHPRRCAHARHRGAAHTPYPAFGFAHPAGLAPADHHPRAYPIDVAHGRMSLFGGWLRLVAVCGHLRKRRPFVAYHVHVQRVCCSAVLVGTCDRFCLQHPRTRTRARLARGAWAGRVGGRGRGGADRERAPQRCHCRGAAASALGLRRITRGGRVHQFGALEPLYEHGGARRARLDRCICLAQLV
mmetsp:Transcript_7563/g.17994  ORF Transcript_7563/g.17994 Transcript_7563/m.17994 type:complete len:253 (-) Transcript_7563:1351-2109(-)